MITIDKIYCLVLNNEKVNNVITQLNSVKEFSNYVLDYDYPSPLYDRMIADLTTKSEYTTCVLQPQQLRCTFHFYRVMKDALVHGYKKIAIFEDDVTFLKDKEKLSIMIENIPDMDVVLFDSCCEDPYFREFALSGKFINKTFREYFGYSYSNVGIVLSDKAMIYLTENLENMFETLDGYLTPQRIPGISQKTIDDFNALKKAIAWPSLCIQNHDNREKTKCLYSHLKIRDYI